ncbi:MAG: hypothetical protein ACTH07_08885 [Microbacterium sp.]|uniref:hypothetical protein n=1 Tax=Microbacterium sp. TaxID=51671 RepID=UPI003F99EFFB
MTITLIAILPGVIVGIGAAMLLLMYAPRTVQVGAALQRIGEAPIVAGDVEEHLTRWQRIGAWIAQHIPQTKFLAAPTAELDLLGETVSGFYATKVRNALIGFAIPFVPGLLMMLVTGQPVALVAGVSIVTAAIFWMLPDINVRRRAREARREFTRFIAVYLQLVAGALLGNATVDNALTNAARVSDTWVFERIRREFSAADLTRTSKWTALERLGDKVGVPAMVNMARTLRLGEARVSLRDQLIAHCEKLRAEVAAADKDAAHRITQRIGAPLMCSILPILALLVVPVAAQFGTL